MADNTYITDPVNGETIILPSEIAAIRTALIYNAPDLTEAEQSQVLRKGFRDFRSTEVPRVSFLARPDSYNHDLDRGSVDLHPLLQNYSYHGVVIPDNSIVNSHNFSQAIPNTKAIEGLNIIFNDCNMCNCFIDPSWILNNCTTVQSWLVSNTDNQGNVVESRSFICSHPNELTSDLLVPPANAIIERSY